MNESDEEADDTESPEDDSPTRVLTIRDRVGECYRLEWWGESSSWIFWLYNQSGFKVGYAYVQARKDSLFLSDLRINDDVLTMRSELRMFVESLGWARRRLIDYRRRGLAKQILVHLEAFASERGYREITGGIVNRDITAWPGLPDWYRRRGYLVFENHPAARTSVSWLFRKP